MCYFLCNFTIKPALWDICMPRDYNFGLIPFRLFSVDSDS